MFDLHMCRGRQRGAQLEHIVIARRPLVSHVERNDCEINALLFQFAIGQRAMPARRAGQLLFAQQFGAAHFKPHRIRGVMRDPHRIALDISNAKCDGV